MEKSAGFDFDKITTGHILINKSDVLDKTIRLCVRKINGADFDRIQPLNFGRSSTVVLKFVICRVISCGQNANRARFERIQHWSSKFDD